ncbi:Transposase, Ptta/En/Spm, plant [Corchorus olitorius]|uniref:Transposase, Ptta/En/Spm, plant n=1 Tax=Corchorus olitorius TaxID=93759 RepID=A0A1R3IKJ2_9ROSI|nr:Transposase, Ptta/En/Spm, plant [Corchorus olitorius]
MRRGRNDESFNDDLPPCSIFNYPGRGQGQVIFRWLLEEELHAAQTYILRNCEEVQPIYQMFVTHLQQYDNAIIDEMVDKHFSKWFTGYVQNPNNQVTDQLLTSLAWGPSTRVKTFSSYFINEYNFHTLEHEIIQLKFSNVTPKFVVLVKCRWFDPTIKGMKIHKKYGIVNLNQKRMYNKYDPFVLAQQAIQVYYSDYPSLKRDKADWLVAFNIKARRTIEARWKEKDIPPYQMDEDEARPIVSTYKVLPPLNDPNGIDLFVDLSDFGPQSVDSRNPSKISPRTAVRHITREALLFIVSFHLQGLVQMTRDKTKSISFGQSTGQAASGNRSNPPAPPRVRKSKRPNSVGAVDLHTLIPDFVPPPVQEIPSGAPQETVGESDGDDGEHSHSGEEDGSDHEEDHVKQDSQAQQRPEIMPQRRHIVPSDMERKWFKDILAADILKKWYRGALLALEDKNAAELKYASGCAKWLEGAMHRCRVKRKKPQWITRAIWKKLVELWDSPEYKDLCAKNKRNQLSDSGATIYRGGCISSIEHRDREVRIENMGKTIKLGYLHQTNRREDGTWKSETTRLAHDKFKKVRAEEAARLGEGAVINDDHLWVKIMGIHTSRCYGLGNLITEMTVFPTRSQSSKSTSTMDTDQSSMKEEFTESRQLIHQQNETLQQQNKTQELILAALQSGGITLQVGSIPVGSGESVSQPQQVPLPDQQANEDVELVAEVD